MTALSIPFSYVPDAGGYSPSVEPAVTRVQFGGGYVQTSARGINLDGAKVQLTFSMRSKAEIDGIMWSIKQSIGNRLSFALAGETTERLWDVKSWTPPVPQQGGQVWSMSMVCEETFEDGHVNWNPLHMDCSTLDGWEWVNQGGSTASAGASGISISVPHDASNSYRYIRKRIPNTGNWSITNSIQDFKHGLPPMYTVYSSADRLFGGIGLLNSRTGQIARRWNGTYPDGYNSGGYSYGSEVLGTTVYTNGRFNGIGPNTSFPTASMPITINASTGIITLGNSTTTQAETMQTTFAAIGGRPDYIIIGVQRIYSMQTRTGTASLTIPFIHLDPL